MWSQTITPTSRQLTVEIPDAFLDQPVEVVLIPTHLSDDIEPAKANRRLLRSIPSRR